MRRFWHTISASFLIALSELRKNKLRSFLSLFGVTIGIFCIITVLATVNSLERNIQNELKTFGTNTIYVDKWEYSATGPDFPYWKYAKRPPPSYNEMQEIKRRTSSARYAAYKIDGVGNVDVQNGTLRNVRLYGVSEDFLRIQPLEIQFGRFLTDVEFGSGSNRVILGYDIAESLFGNPETAVDQSLIIKGKKNIVAGVAKKQGRQLLGGWQFDESIIMPYRYAKSIMLESRSNPLIMVQGREKVNSRVLKDDLTGTMRALHRLKPGADDDFSLNDINDFSDLIRKTFSSINVAGWSIGALAFIVGIFGVANIMFVTVKERTTQIGIKKAVGAKNNLILSEFLLESAFLCIIGGIIGLVLVFVLTKVVSIVYDFPIFLSFPIIALALFISVAAGIVAGIVPAAQAAKMDPVAAIRSN